MVGDSKQMWWYQFIPILDVFSLCDCATHSITLHHHHCIASWSESWLQFIGLVLMPICSDQAEFIAWSKGWLTFSLFSLYYFKVIYKLLFFDDFDKYVNATNRKSSLASQLEDHNKNRTWKCSGSTSSSYPW